jgi:hypothetical protein
MASSKMAIHATRLLSGKLVIIFISAIVFFGAWQLLQKIQESREQAAKALQNELDTLNQDNLALSVCIAGYAGPEPRLKCQRIVESTFRLCFPWQMRIQELEKQVAKASELELLKANLEAVITYVSELTFLFIYVEFTVMP